MGGFIKPFRNPKACDLRVTQFPMKRKLRRQYSQMKDPAVKSRINQLQKQVKVDLRVESQVS